jgi:WD40 repeat protein
MSAVTFIDDTKVMVGFQDGVVKVYDLQADEFIAEKKAMAKQIIRLTSHGNVAVVVGADYESGPILRWNYADSAAQQLKTQSEMMVYQAAWSSDGRYLAAVQSGVGLLVWDTEEWKIAYSYQGHFTSVAWSPTDKAICVGGYITDDDNDDGLLPPAKLIAVDFTGKEGELFSVEVTRRVHDIYWTEDRIICGVLNRILIYSSNEDGPELIKEIPLSDITDLTAGGMLMQMAYSEEKDVAACHLWPMPEHMGQEAQCVSMVSLSNGKVLAKWTAKAPGTDIRDVAFSPNGSRLAVSGEDGWHMLDVDAALKQAGGRVEDEE